MTEEAKSQTLHENLDTAYVNLGALLRYLQGREFSGRVHVELEEYDADVFIHAKENLRVRETDHTTGRSGEGEEALRRLMVRASSPGGLISVYEGAHEAALKGASPSGAVGPDDALDEEDAPGVLTKEDAEWRDLLSLSGELIATVERAAQSVGADFKAIFRAARLGLAEDYPFLDPTTNRLEYAGGRVLLHARPGLNTYAQGLAECLRRVVSELAAGPRGGRVRERVALELAVLARRRATRLAHFKLMPQLDRIAGTRVL
jgi:hypothetical protein